MGSQKANQKKNKQKQQGEKSDPATKKMIADPRFAAVHSDPRFQNVPRNKAKVSIDSRFNRMFTDKNFSSSSLSIDKRGKAKDKSSSNSLRHYYRIDEEEKKRKNVDTDDDDDDDEDDEEEESEGQELKQTKKPGLVAVESSEESEDAEDEDEDAESGGSESDTDTDTDEEEDVEVYMEDEAEVQEESIPVIDQETHRLAVVNMDWRHVKAVDLYMMLSSFLPKDGQILSVAVYPSEFGLQRMKEEEVHGPVGLFDDDDEEKSDEDDGNDEIDDEKLRAYEKSRLKYYYAVVECDSIATADYLYKSCDGVEFERSSNVLDLRFIPDSVEFKHPPRDVATEAPADYDGLDFETQALQQSKINLTWDEDEPHRARTLKRKFNADQLAEMELKEFLASDEGETDDDDDDASEDLNDKKHKKRDMYRALIQSGDGSDDDGDGEEEGQDMEVTFNTGLEDISKRILEKKDKKSESVWEAYLRKRSEKKKARKSKSKFSSEDESSDTDQEVPEEADDFFVEEPSAKRSKEAKGKSVGKEELQHIADTEAEASRAELELLLADDKETNPGVKGYNLKHMKAKGKKGKQDTKEDKIPTIDYDDPRFTSLFKSPLFALDPTDPQFKRSAAYARQVAAQKQQKGSRGKLEREDILAPNEAELQPEVNSEQAQTKKEKLELSSLVRSLKMKAKQVQVPSDAKTSKKDEKAQSRGTTDEKSSLPPKKQSTNKKTKALGN